MHETPLINEENIPGSGSVKAKKHKKDILNLWVLKEQRRNKDSYFNIL